MIPKIVHYIWVGPRPLPADATVLIDRWKALMPDWRFMMWTEENISYKPLFIQQAQGMRAYNRVANYARLVALREHGGFYMDHDMQLLKPLDDLCTHAGVLGFQSDDDQHDLVNNALIGAVPQHPFIIRALGELDRMDGGYDWGSKTGPGLFSRLLRESDAITVSPVPIVASGMVLFPARYFYPYPWNGEFTPECVQPETIAVHLWKHTWKPRTGRWAQTEKFARRCLTKASPGLRSRWVRWTDLAGKKLRTRALH